MKHIILTLFLLTFTGLNAKELSYYALRIKNHKFIPETINVKANERFKLEIINEDDTVEEFESPSLRREKIIPGNKKITINIGPLKPGEYPFIGEFHESTAKGKIIASENITENSVNSN